MKTANHDIDLAEKSYIEIASGKVREFKGRLATKLIDSPDFTPTPFPYSVWEVMSDFHDWRTDCAKPVAILRANQSSLASALNYMKDNCVLVWNSDVAEPA